ncbi:MAG: DUF6549 family protein [Rikenellaceae bacterium]
MSKIRIFITLGFLALVGVVWIQQKRITNIKAERDRQTINTNALLSEQKQWRVDSTTMATNAESLTLTIGEMKRYRADDALKIEAMGLKIRNLEAAARHEVEVEAPIDAPIIDTVIIKDLQPIMAKAVKLKTPHLSIDAIIDRDSLIGSIHLPVTLRQAVWIEYKRKCLFWKRPVAVHQTITSDNPHVKIKYSEYIKIEK